MGQVKINVASEGKKAYILRMLKNDNVLDPDRYPGNKPVMTPKGEFKSVTQAAKAYDRSRTVIYRRCKRQDPGYRYIADQE